MVIDEKQAILINADIDGEISPAETAELQAFLEQSAEGRAMHADLSALCSTLDAVESEDPPPHMRHVIMNSATPTRAKPESPGFIQALFETPALKYAAIFAAGVFLTLSLVDSGQISNGAFDDVTGLVGTVSEPVDATLASSISVDEAEIAGSVSLRSSGSMLILDFDLVAMNPVEIEAHYTDKTIWFNGFAQLESSGTTISAETGHVSLVMEGKRRYAVYLHNEGGRKTIVNLRFIVDGQIIHEASLNYAPGE